MSKFGLFIKDFTATFAVPRYVDDEQLIIIYFEINMPGESEGAVAFDRNAILAYMNHLSSFDREFNNCSCSFLNILLANYLLELVDQL